MRTTGITIKTNLLLLQNAQTYLTSPRGRAPDCLLAVAWEEFHRIYDDLIRRFIVARGVPISDVDDCVQEVWCEIATRLVSFNRPADRSGLRAWLYMLVRSKSADLFRRKGRRLAQSLDRAAADGCEPADTSADPAVMYERKWKQALLESAIGRMRDELSATNCQILCMRLLEHRTIQDVAEELKLSREQVRYRFHRMMKKLKTYVAVTIGKE